MTTAIQTDVWKLGPVQLVHPDGSRRAFGYGAATDSARGAALAAALSAWQSGDAIELGPGTFIVPPSASPTLTVGNGQSIYVRGVGIDRTIIDKAAGVSPYVIYFTGTAEGTIRELTVTGAYVIYVGEFSGRIETSNLGIISSGFDVDNGTGTIVMRGGYSTGGWPVTGCVVDVFGMTLSNAIETLTLGNNTTDPSSNPTIVRMHDCRIEATSNTSVKFVSSDVQLDLLDCVLVSPGSEELNDDNGNVIRINAGTVYTASKIVNASPTLLNQYGTPITAAGLALLDDANATAQRTTLGLGSIATQAASSVAITGGSVANITDLAVADGGTGASTAAGAKANLAVASTIVFNSGQGGSFNPIDNTTYFIGVPLGSFAPSTVGGGRPIYMPAGTVFGVKGAFWSNNSGVSNETVTFYLRVNDTTDYLIATASFGATSFALVNFSNLAMDVAIAAGDFIEIKMVCPTFATNPTVVVCWGSIFIR